MPTSAEALELAGIPVQRLATYGDSERWQAALRSRGAHHHGDAWILAAPDDVDAGLAAAQLTVAPPPSPAGPAADLLGRMARFSNGADHARRRELVSRLLPPVAEAARHAAGLARRLLREECLPPGRGLQSGEGFLRGQAAGFDLMPVARTLPVRALAAALGLQSSQAERAAALTGQLCDTFAPRLTGARTPSATAGSATGGGCVADAPQSADEAASELCALLSATVPLADTETIAAAAGILFQARDATAALIGLAALALADAPVPGWLRPASLSTACCGGRRRFSAPGERLPLTARSAGRGSPPVPMCGSSLPPLSAVARCPRLSAADPVAVPVPPMPQPLPRWSSRC